MSQEMTTSLVVLVDGTPRVSSLDVAARFGKRHDHVIRDIREICANLPESYRAPNFGFTFRDVPGPNGAVRQEPYYLLTRDGFSLLAMGFTGKEALAWKVKFIEAFNAMEQALRSQTSALPDFSSPAEAARAWADEYERRQKAELALSQTQNALAETQVAYVQSQEALTQSQEQVGKLADYIGYGENMRQVKAVPWLLEYFDVKSMDRDSFWGCMGKYMTMLCALNGYTPGSLPDSQWGFVKTYPIDAFNLLRRDLDEGKIDSSTKYIGKFLKTR